MPIKKILEVTQKKLSGGHAAIQGGSLEVAKELFIQVLENIEDILKANVDLPEGILSEWRHDAQKNIGLIYRHQGDSQQALQFYEQALSSAPVSSRSEIYLTIGHIHRDRSDFESALINYQLAQDVASTDAQIATCLNSVGRILQLQGDLVGALKYFFQALDLDISINPHSSQAATRLNNIAGVFQAQGDLESTLEYLESSLEIDLSISPNSADVAVGLNNIGYIYRLQGELLQALDYFDRALKIDEIIEPISKNTAIDINNIGMVYLDQGDFQKALNYFKKALEIDESIDPLSSETATDLNNIGSVHAAQGNIDCALNYFKRALDIDESIASISSQTSADLNNIGYMLQILGDLGSAVEHFQRALKIDEAISSTSAQVAIRCSNIGCVHLERNNIEDALSFYQRAIKVVEQLREKAGNGNARQGWFSNYQNPYHGTIACHVRRGGQSDVAEAFNIAERIRARTLLERLLEKTVRVETLDQQKLLDEEQNLISQIIACTQRSCLTDESIRYNNQLHQDRLEKRLRHIEKRIHQEIPAYATLQSPELLSLEDTRKLVVDSDTLLLSFCVTESVVVGWAIRDWSVPNGVQMFVVGDTQEMNTDIHTVVARFHLPPRIEVFQKALSAIVDPTARQHVEESIRQYREELAYAVSHVDDAWRRLSQNLWNKIWPQLQDSVTRVIVLPDGNLNALPFELLPVLQKQLGDLYSVSYNPSATAHHMLRNLWTRCPVSDSDSPKFLGFGDPYLGMDGRQGPVSNFNRLPNAGREVARAASYFARAVTYFGEDVTKPNINLHLDEASVVLGATHGYLNDADPLGSGLVLAGGEIWEARELLGRRRPLYLELFVASACSSGLGANRAGEGLIGFSAALMAIGIKCAILSLWPVDDTATYHFMTAFFRNWSKTRSVSLALKAARDCVRQHPFYGEDPRFWAGFIAVGLN